MRSITIIIVFRRIITRISPYKPHYIVGVNFILVPSPCYTKSVHNLCEKEYFKFNLNTYIGINPHILENNFVSLRIVDLGMQKIQRNVHRKFCY